MVAFGLKVTNKQAIPKIMEIRKNLLVEDLVKNPWTGKIVAYGKDLFVVIMEPVYPRVYYFAFFLLLLPLFFWGTWVATTGLIIAGVMASLSIFWWDKFYFCLFYVTTKGGVRYVNASATLTKVV